MIMLEIFLLGSIIFGACYLLISLIDWINYKGFEIVYLILVLVLWTGTIAYFLIHG